MGIRRGFYEYSFGAKDGMSSKYGEIANIVKQSLEIQILRHRTRLRGASPFFESLTSNALTIEGRSRRGGVHWSERGMWHYPHGGSA